jgi:hypothetical protein|nr:MAG TPA: major capsid protein [Caudoviricetes sp.]
MAIGTMNPTILDVAKRMTGDGNLDKIVEVMNQTNEILTDMTMLEGNLPTGNVSTVRTGLPKVAWRVFNDGVEPSKSATAQATDTCGMLEAYAVVDRELAKIANNAKEFRLQEDRAFLEAMNQEMASTLFYGSKAMPEKFVGLTPRYSDKTAKSGENIIDAGGTGANLTSIWLVVWSPNTVHGIYPKGSKAGFEMEDDGVVDVVTKEGKKYKAYQTHYQWKNGLTVRDWRYVVRIANIDVTKLKKDASAGADLIDLMIDAEEKVPNLGMGRPVWYMNKTVRGFLRKQLNEGHKYQTAAGEEPGKITVDFNGTPVRRTDALIIGEQQVQ